MDEYVVKRTTLDKLEFPPVVYKYREAENVLHHSILTQGVVYFSPPSGFEDKLDCKIPTRYDLLTDDDIYNKYYLGLKEQFPFETHEQIDARTKEWVAAGLLRNADHIKEVENEYWEKLNDQFGVLCLTADQKNPAMWSKYSAELNGFCVGFDPKIMFPHLGGGGAVEYMNELPIIHPFEDYVIHHNKLAFSKLNKWSFEKEYRTHKTWPTKAGIAERLIKIPGHAFTELIIGDQISEARKRQFIDAAKQQNPNIKIFTASLTGDQITVQ